VVVMVDSGSSLDHKPRELGGSSKLWDYGGRERVPSLHFSPGNVPSSLA
jgi:hypothetical protein